MQWLTLAVIIVGEEQPKWEQNDNISIARWENGTGTGMIRRDWIRRGLEVSAKLLVPVGFVVSTSSTANSNGMTTTGMNKC